MAQVSVLIVEPSEIICTGLTVILSEADGYNVLSPLHDASSLSERLVVTRPDLLVVNPTLLGSSPRQQLAAMAMQRPSMPIVALVYQYVEPAVLECFKYSIDIRAGRSMLLNQLQEALQASGGTADSAEQESYELSERETDVLVLVAKGLSSKEIADNLNISIHTVNSHRKNITRKTGIKSVAGLAVYAMLHNLIEERD